MRRRLRVALLTAAAGVVATITVATAPAQASVPNDFCDPHAYTYIVRTYMRGHEGLPMRCGTKTWGFRHLVAAGRWSAHFDGWIALTLGSGTEVTYLKYGGDEKLFVIFDQRCNAEFWVWYNRGAYNGNGVRPQGLISAYWQDNVIPTTPGQAPAAPQDVPPPPKGGRSDCPVYQPIGNPW